jgi:hypothetical protein
LNSGIAKDIARMNPLEILGQPPVLFALVPHLDTATARALFSSTRRLHTTLKTSAGLRAAVWKLMLGNQPHKNPYYVQIMMGQVGTAGDLPALRLLAKDIKLLAAKNPNYSTEKRSCELYYYWVPMEYALSGAAIAGNFAVIEFLIAEKLAVMTHDVVEHAILSANVATVKYLLDFHPAVCAKICTYLTLHDKNGGMSLANVQCLIVSHTPLGTGHEVNNVTQDHLTIYRMLNS